MYVKFHYWLVDDVLTSIEPYDRKQSTSGCRGVIIAAGAYYTLYYDCLVDEPT